mmetsp:Transcript_82605/g.230341  ORF Transcript_82605/g.230341 Transcript_82605/m.230341 type:complete len:261 (-) Transcript_82605:1141-1923(-)
MALLQVLHRCNELSIELDLGLQCAVGLGLLLKQLILLFGDGLENLVVLRLQKTLRLVSLLHELAPRGQHRPQDVLWIALSLLRRPHLKHRHLATSADLHEPPFVVACLLFLALLLRQLGQHLELWCISTFNRGAVQCTACELEGDRQVRLPALHAGNHSVVLLLYLRRLAAQLLVEFAHRGNLLQALCVDHARRAHDLRLLVEPLLVLTILPLQRHGVAVLELREVGVEGCDLGAHGAEDPLTSVVPFTEKGRGHEVVDL